MVGAPHVLVTISDTPDTELPEIAGSIGDVDRDGRGDFATGAVNVLIKAEDDEEKHYREARLFRGAALDGAVLIDDAERRIGYDVLSLDHSDLTGDGVEDPFLSSFSGGIGIMDGASVFP